MKKVSAESSIVINLLQSVDFTFSELFYEIFMLLLQSSTDYSVVLTLNINSSALMQCSYGLYFTQYDGIGQVESTCPNLVTAPPYIPKISCEY